MSGTLKQRIGSWLIPRLPFTQRQFDIFRREFLAFRVRMACRLNPAKRAIIRRYKQANDLSVNVAAGPFGQEGWVNLDIMKHPGISFTYDCRKRLPFRDLTVARIRAEHVFEHFDHKDEAPFFLREAWRVMQPGAVLRIVVPDVEKHCKAYVAATAEAWAELGWDLNNLPADLPTPAYLLNHVFNQDGEHLFAYDYESLSALLAEAGFVDISRQAYGQSKDAHLEADQPNHKPYSLYVDAVKP